MASPYQFGTRSEETELLQRRLTEHGFDTRGFDGIYGRDTRDAVQAAQEHFGISPADGVPRGDLLAFLGLAEASKPKPSIIPNWLLGLAINQIASKLKDSNMSFLLGTKTAITGVVMIVVGAASLLAPIIGLGSIPGLDVLTPGEAMAVIGNGFGLIFLRGAVAKIG